MMIKNLFKPKCLKSETCIKKRKKVSDAIYFTICEDSFDGVHTRIYIVDNKNKNIIGSCMLSHNNEEISDLYILEEYRRQGYGYKLLKFCIENYNSNFLMVYNDNIPAINLYLKLGFEKRFDNGITTGMSIKPII